MAWLPLGVAVAAWLRWGAGCMAGVLLGALARLGADAPETLLADAVAEMRGAVDTLATTMTGCSLPA